MNVIAVIAAAGQGRRMGAGKNKQFLSLAGRPVLAWCLEAFAASETVDGLVVVVRPGEEERFAREVQPAVALEKPLAVVAGGAERQDSVRRGIAAAPAEAEIILVHDGARPLVTPQLIDRVVEAARRHGAAIPVLPVSDTIKRIGPDGAVVETLDRQELRAVQTPQGFRAGWLREAHERARKEGRLATDDAALLEGVHPVATVAGEYSNFKLTSPEDLILAEAVLEARERACG